ncbi:hypothetical protein VNI00_005477 [Paramarasmius palmivorus]|uniref:Beta-lactamase-related domain-containing protein n=1 Tax=Paramarasmius palmivorus TaxID=297713 RepID=A0AAW0DE89_9AGAR
MRLLALALLSLYCSTLAQITQHPLKYANSTILDPTMDGFIEGVISSWNSSGGASVAVVKQYEDGSWQVETKGYGIAKVAEGKKLDADSLFYIAKLFTAIATGMLVSNKSLSPRLSWDTKIADILPEHLWKLQDPIASAETTITDAMGHRTGLPNHDSMYSRKDPIEVVLQKFRHLKPSASFRTTWQYTNIMYILLSYLPTASLPQKPSLAEYVREHIFEPLGLTSATYSLAAAKSTGRLADPIARDVNKTEDLFGKGKTRVLRYPTWFQEDSEDGSYMAGAAGVIMNVKDAATWLQVLLLEGQNPWTGEQVIPREVVRKVASGISIVRPEPQCPEVSNVVYGGGQMRGSYRGHDYIEHDGGYATRIARLPNSKFGVAVFTNEEHYGAPFMEVIKWHIIDTILGLEPIDWDSRMRAIVRERYQRKISRAKPRPENPAPPPLPLEQLAGVYQNPGYRNIEFCLVSSPPPVTESVYCRRLRKEQPVILPNAVNHNVPTLLAWSDSFWYSHIKLEHVDGALFTAKQLDSRARELPTDDPEQPYWTSDVDAPYTAEFVIEDEKVGFGMMDGFWGSGPGIEGPIEGSARERAEVWFERI